MFYIIVLISSGVRSRRVQQKRRASKHRYILVFYSPILERRYDQGLIF